MEKIRKMIKNTPGIIILAVALFVIFLLVVPNFANARNLNNIFKNASVLLIVSIGMTLAILSKQIDMSIGGVICSSAMISAVFLTSFAETTSIVILMTILVGILVGIIFGVFNGVMIAYLNYNYWLVTFASMSIATGLAKIVTNGYIIAGFEKSFRNLGGGEFLGVSSIIYISLFFVIVMAIVTKETKFGMAVYAIGDSEQCAKQSGINVKKVRLLIYMISGALAGFAGVLLISKTNSANVGIGIGYEFDAIAAVIVGGTPFSGGRGGVIGTVIGALLIEAVKSALQLVGLNSFWQQTLIGVFILLIIVIDVVNMKIKTTNQMRRMYK